MANYGIVKNINFSDKKINIECVDNKFNNKLIILTAQADCSYSYFVIHPTMDNNEIEKIIKHVQNKTLVSVIRDINETKELSDYFDTKNITGDHIKLHYNKLEFLDGTELNFLLVNDSNGYYDGWTEMNIENIEYNKTNNKSIITVIVGLPGSGKTTLSKHIAVESEKNNNRSVIYDDVVSNMYGSDFLLQINDKEKKHIIISDPRFCIQDVFCGFAKELQKYVPKENIKVILFENNKEQCHKNLKLRETDNSKLEKITKSLNNLKPKYDTSSEVYTNLSCFFVPVFDCNYCISTTLSSIINSILII